MIPGTTFNIDIAKEVWQEEAREEAREKYEQAIADKDNAIADMKVENERLARLVIELQGGGNRDG